MTERIQGHGASRAQQQQIHADDEVTFLGDTNVRPGGAPSRTATGLVVRDEFTATTEPARVRVRHGVDGMGALAAMDARASIARRERLDATIAAVRALPRPPDAIARLPPRPETLRHAIARQHDEAFRNGLSSLIAHTTSAALGARDRSLLNGVLTETDIAVGHQVDVHRGQTLGVLGRASAMGAEEGLGLGVGLLAEASRVGAGAGVEGVPGVLLNGLFLQVEAVGAIFEQGEERAQVAARESEWLARREAAVRQTHAASADGRFDAGRVSLEQDAPGGRAAALDWNRLRDDGDYYAGVLAGLSARRAELH